MSTALSGGSVEECLVAGLIGAGSAAVGFGLAFVTGFSPVGNIAGRAVASTLCDLGTTWYRNGEVTGQDIGLTVVDVAFDVSFSTITYYYTDPIQNFGKQTLINSCIDGSVDILETIVYSADNESAPSVKQKNSGYSSGLLFGGNHYDKYAILLR